MIYLCNSESEEIVTQDCLRISTNGECNLIISDNSFSNDYVQVFILEHSEELEVIVRDKKTTLIVFSNVEDGLYTIRKLLVPRNIYKPYFYKKGSFYRNNYEDDIAEEITLLALIEINPNVSNLYTETYRYFSTCNIRKCFIRICQDILNLRTSDCNHSPDSSKIYKRDLLWSALNVIHYMVELEQFEEAQRLLEEMTSCNGLCPKPKNNSTCGCR